VRVIVAGRHDEDDPSEHLFVDTISYDLHREHGELFVRDVPVLLVRASAHDQGTDDKAGSALNLLRFTAARAIKETFVPPTIAIRLGYREYVRVM
jgi:hypothetical protein